MRSLRSWLARPFYTFGDTAPKGHEWSIAVADSIVHGPVKTARAYWREAVRLNSTPYPGEGWVVLVAFVLIIGYRVFA